MTTQTKIGRNTKLLNEFAAYCIAHPEERFWQALRNWAEVGFVLAVSEGDWQNNVNVGKHDTFYWEGRNQ